MTSVIAAQIDYWRGVRGMSAQRLADRTAELGLPVARNTIANLENGRRGSVSVAEVLVLASALNVPPIMLLLPIGRARDIEITPGRPLPVGRAIGWFIGQPGWDGSHVDVPLDSWRDWSRAASVIWRMQRHSRAVIGVLAALEANTSTGAERVHMQRRDLAEVRDEMRAAGEPLPDLPEGILPEEVTTDP